MRYLKKRKYIPLNGAQILHLQKNKARGKLSKEIKISKKERRR